MNVLFLAENPQLFIEYAVRLERSNISFWTADNNNDFHKKMAQIKIDVVFADYHFMNFKEFDVYQHISKYRKDLVFLFLNEPGGVGELLVQWEDRVRQYFPEQWSEDMELLLRTMTNQKTPDDLSCQPARVQDLMGQVERNSGNRLPQQLERTIEEKSDSVVMETMENEGFPPEPQRVSMGAMAFENGSLEEFMELHRKYKLGYQEYMLMNLFFRRLNQFVELYEMIQTLHIPQDKKGVNAVYQYIYRIRNFLERMGRNEVQLIRVKKGCYSLVSHVS